MESRQRAWIVISSFAELTVGPVARSVGSGPVSLLPPHPDPSLCLCCWLCSRGFAISLLSVSLCLSGYCFCFLYAPFLLFCFALYLCVIFIYLFKTLRSCFALFQYVFSSSTLFYQSPCASASTAACGHVCVHIAPSWAVPASFEV